MMCDSKRLFWFGLVFCLLHIPVSNAEESQDDQHLNRSITGQDYHDQIQSVLEQKAFGEKEKVKRWRLKDQKKEENKLLEWLSDLLNGIERDRNGAKPIAFGIELLLWFLLIGLILYLLFKYRTQLQSIISGIHVAADPALPATMFGLDVNKNSLPEDVIGSAQLFWQSGDYRQAIALLLRSSLIKLLHEHDCVFLDSDTEAECYARIERQVPKKISQYMHLLVKVWQQIAYGHRVPNDNVFNTLCHQWQEVF